MGSNLRAFPVARPVPAWSPVPVSRPGQKFFGRPVPVSRPVGCHRPYTGFN